MHPEEGVYDMVTDEVWRQHMNVQGQVEDDFQLRKVRQGVVLIDMAKYQALCF